MCNLRRVLATACMLCLFTLPGSSVSRGADADWLTYNRTLAGDRFSPLKEIDRSNVTQLKAICTYTLPEVSSLQTGPLVVDEPPRVCRRLFRLSHAAMAGCSVMA